jgi:hypothetical protein
VDTPRTGKSAHRAEAHEDRSRSRERKGRGLDARERVRAKNICQGLDGCFDIIEGIMGEVGPDANDACGRGLGMWEEKRRESVESLALEMENLRVQLGVMVEEPLLYVLPD